MIRSFILACAAVLGVTGLVLVIAVVRVPTDASTVPAEASVLTLESVTPPALVSQPILASSTIVSTETIIRDLPWPTGIKLVTPPVDTYNQMRGEYPFSVTDDPVAIPVLMYHHIRPLTKALTPADKRYSVDPLVFRAQILSLLKDGFTPISMDVFTKAVLSHDRTGLPEKPVLLTFDDGFRSQYEHVFPLLKEAHIPATFFVLSDGHESIYMTKAMIKEMAASPYVTIADHTRRHPRLTRLSAAAREAQILGSKRDLETLIGKAVKTFAYPYGDWNNQVAKEIQADGYDLAFGIRLGSEQGVASRWQLRRIPVTNGWDMAQICERFLKPQVVTKKP